VRTIDRPLVTRRHAAIAPYCAPPASLRTSLSRKSSPS
jgi:hypothetical protein